MTFLRVYQHNTIQDKTTLLIFEGKRWILPLGLFPTRFSRMIDGLLQAERMITSVAPLPDLHLPHYHFLTTRKPYVFHSSVVRKLEEAGAKGVILMISEFEDRKINDFEAEIDTLYSVLIGIQAENLELWTSTINSATSGLRHRLYSIYLLNRYFPPLWRLVRQVYIPFLGNFITERAKNLVYSRKLLQIFEFPRYDRLSEQIFEYEPPAFENFYRYRLGNLISHGFPIQDFGIPLSDLAQGGIIAGAIGTGKTTLRLHLLRLCRAHGLRVIDFDLKGDATRYEKLVQDGKVVIPGVNFHLNPFLTPKGFTAREYANILFQSFVETIPAGSELSPPQLHLLTRAIAKTVNSGGNAQSFFKNLYSIAAEEQQFIDNKQDSTALAILTRFNWMQTVMHDIFWYDTSSLLITDYAETSLYFDLSKLDMTVTKPQIRFLINLVMARIMATLRNRAHTGLRDVIFLDETQLLMPRRSDNTELSKLEQTVTTLRYKGVSVVATGVSAALMSPVLLDVGFVAQFRSESESLHRALALSEEEEGLIPQLPQFHTMIRAKSLGSKAVMVKTREFVGKYRDSTSETIKLSRKTIPLSDFDLDFTTIWSSRLESAIFDDSNTNSPVFSDLRALAHRFVEDKVTDFSFKPSDIENQVNQWIDILNSTTTEPVIVRYRYDYLLHLVYWYFIRLLHQVRYDPQLNLLSKNYQSMINSVRRHIIDQLRLNPQKSGISGGETSKFSDLQRLLDRVQEAGSLSLLDFQSLIVQISACIEQFGRNFGSPTGLLEVLEILTARGWLHEQKRAPFDQFRKIRNRVVHGSYATESVDTDLPICYAVGREILSIWRAFDDLMGQSDSKYNVEDDENDK
jgi:hypothetical protein